MNKHEIVVKDVTKLWGGEGSPLHTLRAQVRSLNNQMVGTLGYLIVNYPAELEGMMGNRAFNLLVRDNQKRRAFEDLQFKVILHPTDVVWYTIQEIQDDTWKGCFEILQEIQHQPKTWFELIFPNLEDAKNFLDNRYPDLIWITDTLAARIA